MPIRAGLLGASGLIVAVLLPATGAGAASVTTAIPLGAPSGIACVTTVLNGTNGNSPLTLGDDLPFDAYNGVPLLNLLEGPATGASNYPALDGYNCGNIAHGASAVTLGSSVHQSFADTASGQLGMSETGTESSSTLLNNSLVSSATLGEALQEQTATVTPVLAAGDDTLTISVTYRVLSESASSALSGSDSLGADLDYVGGPTCNGQDVEYQNTGTPNAGTPGTYTAGFVFTCPAGETMASGPINVDFDEVEDLLLFAGHSFTSSITGELVGATMTAGE
jgi:hypothetical protein